MSEAFYSHAKLYDLRFPSGGPAGDSYRAEADRPGGRVLELQRVRSGDCPPWAPWMVFA